MKKVRRGRLKTIAAGLDSLQADLEATTDDERQALDNLPDSLRSAPRGETMEEGVDALERVADELNDIITTLTELATEELR